MVSLYDASREDITTLLEGQPAFRMKQVWEGLYQQFIEPAQMLTLPVALRNKLNEQFPPALNLTTLSVSDKETPPSSCGLLPTVDTRLKPY